MPIITGTTGPNILSGDVEWREDLGQFVSTPTVDEIFGLAGDDTIDTASLYFLEAIEPVDFVALEPGGGYAPMVGGMPYAHVSGIEIFAQIWGGKANDRLGAKGERKACRDDRSLGRHLRRVLRHSFRERGRFDSSKLGRGLM